MLSAGAARPGGRCLAAAGAAILLALPACRTAPGAPGEPGADADQRAAFEPGWRLANAGRAATGASAMVASNDSLATMAGVEILRRGGNAVDAAIAVGFALAVTHPEAGNLGGGGFMLIRRANSGETFALDFRETAPAAASRDMFAAAARAGVSNASTHGHLASGVPGSVAGLTEALARHGTLPLATVIAPAIRLARDGFLVDATFSRAVASSRSRIAAYAGAGLFLPGGSPVPEGTVLRQPALARTLEIIAASGAAGFYRGTVALAIESEMARNGGLLRASDLEGYRAVWRKPLVSRYRGHTVIGMPPPSSGGVAVAGALNVLATFGDLPPFGSAGNAHLVASVLHRAFIDRSELLGDPDRSPIPVDLLLSDGYARRVAATINLSRAAPTSAARAAMREGNETTHWAVADAAGNVVSATTTINDHFGSGVFVEEAGFFLNDEMDDFAATPGRPTATGVVPGEANAIAPRKRMTSAMAPTIVLDPSDRVLLLVGSRGGPRIMSSVLQVILNTIDHRMTLLDAMRAPRVHPLVTPDSLWYEPTGFSAAVVDSLARMGHALRPIRTDTLPYIGRVIAIARRGRAWEGVVDPRYPGHAAGF